MKQYPMLHEPTASAQAEITVKRSRFIAAAVPVDSVVLAEARLTEVRSQHPDSNHVVYAFLIGDERSEQAGVSDAGEPKGTAGRPVMEILRGSGVRDVIITVVRYFGGTKLGTGGLVHAYGDAARAVLERLPTRPRVARVRLCSTVGYDALEPVRAEIVARDGVVVEERFGTRVEIEVEIPEEQRDALAARIRDITRGGSTLEAAEQYLA
ncbi:MAG: IMPACT family protein [Spirochaetota bacterium]